MNDRFKFRVWNVQDQEYIYLSLINKDRLSDFAYFADEVTPDYDEQVKCSESNCWALIIEQCTGLKDKNGNLIYEGDIVTKEFTDRPFSNKAKSKMKNCSVYWHKKGEFLFKYKNDKYKYYSVPYDSFIGDCEIIGNIHENPELLE